MLLEIGDVLGVHLGAENRREVRRRAELLGALLRHLLLAQNCCGLLLTDSLRCLLLLEALDPLLQMVQRRFEFLYASIVVVMRIQELFEDRTDYRV
jgi:hypothetical protein